MKRILKIVIPIVVIVALIVTAVWFFLFHRPDLTNKFLISQANNMIEDGRYSRGIKYYKWAWSLEPDRNDIPIMLAEAYAASGNYTKAEYTLVKAVSSNPDVLNFYIALSRIYVAQDKLLDATQMLDRITNPEVKAQLDELRPKAPVIQPEGGYYNEYIEVSIESEAAKNFVTYDGNYPSSDNDLYLTPYTLEAGETSVLAIAVDDDGLVSTVARSGFTVGGVVEAITLSDPAVDRTVRNQLSLEADDEMMSDLLWSITHLSLPDTVRNLSDLSKFTGLRSLTLNGVSGLDFTVLSQLPSLQELNLSGCTISSNALTAIGSLVELERLVLDSCALTDISAFSQLTKIKELCLSNNSIEDIGPVSLMTNLESLTLANNPISSIAALSACKDLKYLDISSCSITSLGSLSGNSDLETLLASNNTIRSLEDLNGCRHLSVLEVNSNLIHDISVLTQLPDLTRFEANHNEIKAIPDFDEDNCKLIYFGINYNQVTDINGLADINSLNYINIDYNKVTDLMPVSKNINLIKVNAWDNDISAECVKELTDYGIIVNYNPNYKTPDEE